MLRSAFRRLGYLCSGLRWALPHRRRPRHNVTVRCYKNPKKNVESHVASAAVLPDASLICLATFNATMFSMAPAVGAADPEKAGKNRPPAKGILKQQKLSALKRWVSINLPEDKISSSKGKDPAVVAKSQWMSESFRSEMSVLDVLKEVGADVIAVQNVHGYFHP